MGWWGIPEIKSYRKLLPRIWLGANGEPPSLDLGLGAGPAGGTPAGPGTTKETQPVVFLSQLAQPPPMGQAYSEASKEPDGRALGHRTELGEGHGMAPTAHRQLTRAIQIHYSTPESQTSKRPIFGHAINLPTTHPALFCLCLLQMLNRNDYLFHKATLCLTRLTLRNTWLQTPAPLCHRLPGGPPSQWALPMSFSIRF